MSKNQKPQTKSFKYTPTQSLPKLSKHKTDWDLKGLYYKSEKDPEIEKDLKTAELACSKFVKKYKDTDFTKQSTKLLRSLKDYKNLCDLRAHKPAYYLSLRRELNSQDVTAEKALNLLEQRLTKLGNRLIFYGLALGKIHPVQQKTILKDRRFSEYHYYLSKIFKQAQHSLSEPEEKVLSLKSITSRNLWISGTEKILGDTTVKVGKKIIPLNGALMKVLDAPRKERHILWNACATALENIGPVAENELTALYTDKKIEDELRNFARPYSSTALSFDNEEKSIDALVSAVTSKGYALSKRYFKIKKKILNTELTFIDRNEKLKTLPPISFEDAVTICRDVFYQFNNEYGRIFDEMLSRGHLDVYPKTGKGGGAFCAGGKNVPTLILLNHSDDFNSLRTLAHEMGHAIHSYRSKTQPVIYSDHSTVTAETASTFFEALVGQRLYQQAESSLKLQFLDSLIGEKIDTMIMCIARFQAELELHLTVRQEGAMTWQDMTKVLAKHFRQYCGPAIKVRDQDGLSLIAKTHYRRNFYQYTYSFGNIASSIMLKRYLENSSYSEEVDKFLCAGEKDTVENIFKEIGIDTTNAKVFEEGLSLLETEIDALEQQVKANA